VTWVALAGAFCVFDLWRKVSVGLTDGDGRPIGDDFVNYFSGAFLALHQRAAEIYHWNAYHAFQEATGRRGGQPGTTIIPTRRLLLVLTLPFALMPYVPALGVWLIGGWYAFYRALRLALPDSAADPRARGAGRVRQHLLRSERCVDRGVPRRGLEPAGAAVRCSPECCSGCRCTSASGADDSGRPARGPSMARDRDRKRDGRRAAALEPRTDWLGELAATSPRSCLCCARRHSNRPTPYGIATSRCSWR